MEEELKPTAQFETFVIPETEGTIDTLLAEAHAEGFRIIHQHDVVVYDYDDKYQIVHIVRLQRTINLKEVSG